MLELLLYLFDVEVRTDDDATFNTSLSSKCFMKHFILLNDFTASTRSFRFEDY